MRGLAVLIALWATACPAEEYPRADVVFLGEVHDNPAHHAWQAEAVDALAPRAIVWEMLDARESAAVTQDIVADRAALDVALGWSDSGWPEFALYHPIFAAAPGAAHYGAELPRQQARAVMQDGRTSVAVSDDRLATLLRADLDPEQAKARATMQATAHCGALPVEMLPLMVDVQRVRDTLLADAALRALAETGGPVAVITGNGHARRDWGAAWLVAQVAGDASVVAVGQAEDGRGGPDGVFDLVRSAPPVDRGDPCAAFGQ